MKPIRYTRHARRVTRFWGIQHEDILATLREPDRVFPTEKSRQNAVKQLGGRFLRVTYTEAEDHILVITVTPRKRPW